jgi:glycosyltransferase involved in cell wall biosynthesis
VEESYGKYLKARVVPLPYLPPPYIMEPVSQTDSKSVRQKYHLPDRFLFYPAQFWMHKNHLRLIQAIHKLHSQGYEVPLLLAGSEKNNTRMVKNLIAELHLESNVRILGYIPDEDIIGIYQAATALVMPTFFGPTNIPIVEAIYLGTPVLCSNIYGHPEQVGNAGLLFDPTSVEDIAEKILAIWTNEELRQELIKHCLDRKKCMNLSTYAECWENIIEKVVEK